eukprot:CAMPEP_0173423904 /NCGR_PEP_ID=MMETSP1357-20121228/4012_1 /TAXON_ID=77926 /ORGANISM="Hemiselmis rufescens, Strain PCC563" /LENGTH=114 /DNA_ID=CAMNT_0014387067 /DNA_START=119 /DNA_END=460 /DNA_ORIENTATION=-
MSDDPLSPQLRSPLTPRVLLTTRNALALGYEAVGTRKAVSGRPVPCLGLVPLCAPPAPEDRFFSLLCAAREGNSAATGGAPGKIGALRRFLRSKRPHQGEVCPGTPTKTPLCSE